MGRYRGRPRLKRWRGQPYIYWTDYSCNPPKLRRTSCHARDAHDRDEQSTLLNEFLVREKLHSAEAVKLGAAFDYEHPLLAAIKEYRSHVQERQKTKQQNPNALEGLSISSVASIEFTLDSMVDWLELSGKNSLTTGRLDGSTLGQFFTWLARGRTKHGNKSVVRSAATLNKHKRNVKACLKFLNNRRPKLFPDFEILRDALKAQAQDLGPPASFSAAELSNFLSEAIEYEKGPLEFSIERRKKGRKKYRALPSGPVELYCNTCYSGLSATGPDRMAKGRGGAASLGTCSLRHRPDSDMGSKAAGHEAQACPAQRSIGGRRRADSAQASSALAQGSWERPLGTAASRPAKPGVPSACLERDQPADRPTADWPAESAPEFLLIRRGVGSPTINRSPMAGPFGLGCRTLLPIASAGCDARSLNRRGNGA
jgi:hypothetical protein